MVINSKEACLLLTDELNIVYGKEKSKNVTIPQEISINWNLVKHTLRGIVDTDGSVFAVKKPRIEKYPSIEITTISYELAKQIKEILEAQGFRVTKIWEFNQNMSENKCYRFGLNGKDSLKKWINEIGFSNPYKLERAISYIK